MRLGKSKENIEGKKKGRKLFTLPWLLISRFAIVSTFFDISMLHSGKAKEREMITGWNKANSKIPALPEPTILATFFSFRIFLELEDVDSIMAIANPWGCW